MNLADWLIIGAILLSVAVAAAQGFLYEVFSLAGVIVGYLAAAWGYSRVAAWYAPLVKMPWVADVAGFLTIFLAVLLLAGTVAKLARWGMNKGGLRWFDRTLGGVFGLVRGMLLVTVVLVAAGSWTPDAPWLAKSQIAPYLLILGRAAVWVAPSEVRMQFHQGTQQLRQLRSPQRALATGK
jgi:membrane protein required for colicin V production